MKTQLNLCIVHWWDKEASVERIENCLCHGLTFSECAKDLEEYFGNENIISMEITPLDDGPLSISTRIARLVMDGEALEGEVYGD